MILAHRVFSKIAGLRFLRQCGKSDILLTHKKENNGSDPFGGVESGGVAYPFAISRRPFVVILYFCRGECGFASPTCAM